MRFFSCLVFSFLFLTSPSLSEELDLELVLLADATGSIDDAEIRFQRAGYAQAITDPAVLNAITDNIYGKIAVTYVEWADMFSQDVVVDWTVIDGRASAEAFAARLMEAPRQAYGRNAIGAALLKGKELIDTNAYQGLRRVIDLSADSANNWNGPTISEARETVVSSGIVINGLAVLCRHCSGRPVTYDLEDRFYREIIGGPAAFVVTADSAQTFADAVRKKLILEIAENPQDAFRLLRQLAGLRERRESRHDYRPQRTRSN
ncbi:DUF1194 domain-containing protein [Roseibium aggregatum]|uniref:DUF1194 domain-containing protein n=1 Tax=Roseibium aggregatum TaxID=187304 RepID=A0A939EHT6_9HYPH|nr:DUF1194 domain-containing protein [Roseibium aggregatum]MBN9671814.1 DUF1194 domain-containing protein [Roseibium aggregatum]